MTPLPPFTPSPPSPPLWVTMVVAMAVVVATSGSDGAGGSGGSGAGGKTEAEALPEADKQQQVDEERSRAQCGGVLTEPKGILATPNFPGAPPVPLHCHWIINASWVRDGNITVYLTQQYVLRGLILYVNNLASNGDAVEEQVLYSAEDSSVLNPTYYVRSDRQAVFVNLSLPRLEGNHLRVLQGLRDVYGFNITYEVTNNGEPGRQSCTPMSCSGVGHCLANQDFTSFSCKCPTGYAGVNCSSGPMCAANPCRNGGTCKVAGTEAIVCDCRTTNFSGVYCQNPPIPDDIGGCESNKDEVCKCSSGPHVDPVPTLFTATFIQSENTTRTLTNQLCSNSYGVLRSPVESLQSLKRNLTKIFDVLINTFIMQNMSQVYDVDVVSIVPNASITVEFTSDEGNEETIGRALANLLEARWSKTALEAVRNVVCFEAPFTEVVVKKGAPRFYIEKVASNENEVEPLRCGSQVVFSCRMAAGSSNVSFSWYKEGHLVTPNKKDRIWTEISRDSDGRVTSLLCVEHLEPQDSGRWTCRAQGSHFQGHNQGLGQTRSVYQQCRSIDFNVQQKPIVRMQPPAVSALQGAEVFLSCLASNDDGIDEFKYSWSRNGIPLISEQDHVWELLEYPRGCLLRLRNISISATYTCHVESRYGNASVSAPVEVLTEATPQCDADGEWPAMPAGAVALVECLEGSEESLARRECVPIRAGQQSGAGDGAATARWNEPDFSACLPNEAIYLENDLREISLGYDPSTPREIINRLRDIVLVRQRSSFRPRQGEAIFALAMDAWRQVADQPEVHGTMLKIIDSLLSFPRALVSPKVLENLLEVTLHTGLAHGSTECSQMFYEHLAIQVMRPNRTDCIVCFTEERLRWLASLQIQDLKLNFSPVNSLIVVQLQSLSLEDILPNEKRERKRKHMDENGSIGLYRILSTVVTTALSVSNVSPRQSQSADPADNTSVSQSPSAVDVQVEATFDNVNLNLEPLLAEAQQEAQYWNLSCGYARYLADADPWDLESCTTLVASVDLETQRASPTIWIPWRRAVAFVSRQRNISVKCVCRAPGTYAVLFAAFSQKPNAGGPSVAVILALWCCALEATAALVLLFVVAWRKGDKVLSPGPATPAPSAAPAPAPTPSAQGDIWPQSAAGPSPDNLNGPTTPEASSVPQISATSPDVISQMIQVEPVAMTALRITSCINTALVAVIMATTMCQWDTLLPAVVLQCLLLLGISLPTAQLYLVAVELGAFPLFSIGFSSLWPRQCSRSQATAIIIAIAPVAFLLVLWVCSRDIRSTLSHCWSSWLEWGEPACWAVAVPSSLVALGGVLIAATSKHLFSVVAFGKRVNKNARCGSVARLCVILICQLAFLFSAIVFTSAPGVASHVAFVFTSFLLGYSLLMCYVVRLGKQWTLLPSQKKWRYGVCWTCAEDCRRLQPRARTRNQPAQSSTSTTDCGWEARWLPKILRRPTTTQVDFGVEGRLSVPNESLSSLTANPPLPSPPPTTPAPSLMAVDSPHSGRPLIASPKSCRRFYNVKRNGSAGAVRKATASNRSVGKPRQLVFPSHPLQSAPNTPTPSEDEDIADSSLLPLRVLEPLKRNNGYLYMHAVGENKVVCSADVHAILGGRKPKRTERMCSTSPRISGSQALQTNLKSEPPSQCDFRRRFLRLDDIEEVDAGSMS